MKKVVLIALIFVVSVVVSACGGGKEPASSLTLGKFVQAYKDAGVQVDEAQKPIFSMIGAKDGVIFYQDKKKVAIYEFASERELKTKQEENALISSWKNNGRFLLETGSDEASAIFEKVK